MTQTQPDITGTDAAKGILRCPHLPPLNAGTAAPAPVFRHPAGLSMLRRGLLVLAALALPALGALLADPVHRARGPQAAQAAVAPRPPLAGAAAASPDPRTRIVLSALDAPNPAARP